MFSYFSVMIHYISMEKLSSLGHPIRERAIRYCRIVPIASVVVLRSRQRPGLDIQKGRKLTPTIRPVAACREAWTKRERSLIDQKVDIVCRGPGCIGICWRRTVGGYGAWGFDYLNVDACSEWLKMGYDELLICWRSGRRQELCKLSKSESGQHSCEIGVMGKVKVEALIQWESSGVVVESDVGLSCGGIQGAVVHSRQELLDISYSNCTPGRGLEVVVSGKR